MQQKKSFKSLCGFKEEIYEILLNAAIPTVTLFFEIEDAFDIKRNKANKNPFEFSTVQSVIGLVPRYCGDLYE